MDRLTGIHAVREALEANRPLDSLLVAKGTHGNRMEELVRLARKQDVPVRFEERAQVDRAAGTREHQGVVAFVASSPTASFYDLMKPRTEGSAPGMLVLLDGVEDPQNLGAIVRTSLAAGAQGVVIPERRAAGLTDAVARASAGALAHLPVARVTNLSRAMEEMKEAGYWLVGLDERAEQLHTEVDFKDSGGNCPGRRGQRVARAGARALRLSGFDPHHGASTRLECIRGGRGCPVRGRSPAPRVGNADKRR